MARRREPQRPQTVPEELPTDLAMGPCLEVWATDEPPPAHVGTNPAMWLATRARHAWADAVDGWANESGWAGDGRPVSNARNLARTRYPWSRDFLLARGEHDYVAWLEGRRDTNPGRPRTGWQPHY